MLENGAVAFDLGQSKYSISGEYNQGLLHAAGFNQRIPKVRDASIKAYRFGGIDFSQPQTPTALPQQPAGIDRANHSSGKFLVEGLHLFVPNGCSAPVRERMANLNRGAAKWRLVEVDCADRGNVATRLVHAANEPAAMERFAEFIDRIQTIHCRTRHSQSSRAAPASAVPAASGALAGILGQ